MDILDYESTVNPKWWLDQLLRSDWIAGQYLHTLLSEGRFHAEYGEKARVLLLADGPKLVSFCAYAERDEIPDAEMTPWMGFVYHSPISFSLSFPLFVFPSFHHLLHSATHRPLAVS